MNYKTNFTNFVKKCSEKEKEITALRNILENKKRGSLLDVGGGNGCIALGLNDLFNEIVIVEKNGQFKNNCHKIKAKFSHTYIEEFNTRKKFDVVIASHVFPYLENDTKEFVINKLYTLLKKNGLLIVIEMTKQGQIGFIKEIILRDKLISTYELVKKILKTKNIIYQEITIKPRLTAESAESIVELIKFFAEKYNGQYEQAKEKLITYASEKLYSKNDNKYHLTYINKIIIINKKEAK